MHDPTHLEIIPLGGLGEFGMNMMAYRWGEDVVLIDAGMMFAGCELLGVEALIPDLTFLEGCGKLHGLILTHAHEDHIGAVPHLLDRFDLPVFATPYTTACVRRRLSELGVPHAGRLQALPLDGSALDLGPFRVESLSAAHSIPQSRMIVLHTPVGSCLHTSDFKLDSHPVDGPGTDLSRLARLGDEGLLLLLSDSTNADRSGFTPGDRQVTKALDDAIAHARGRIVITTFASQIHRLQLILDLARKRQRRVAFFGSSVRAHVDIAEQLGLLRVPAGVRVPRRRIMGLAAPLGLAVAGGSQGEPGSAMARISTGTHEEFELSAGDLVIHSARRIPGTEGAVERMLNACLRRGADVVTAEDAAVHVSGHASAEELKLLIGLTRPRFFVPIHGGYRQLLAHTRLAERAGLPRERILLVESGELIRVNAQGIGRGEPVAVGQVFLGGGLAALGGEIVRDRRRLAGNGIVVPVVALQRGGGVQRAPPEVHTRGFAAGLEGRGSALLGEVRDVVARVLDATTADERQDEALLRDRIQTDLRKFLRRRTGSRPLVLPVIVEY